MHVAKLHGQNPIALLGVDYFDLSDYVRTQRDDGLVIDDTDFLAPQFGDTPLAEGQPLLAVTAGLQEKAYALGLNDGTAADCVALQQALTWHVGQNGPLVLEEQQEGASEPVFRDVSFARFEPETNVRRAAHGWRIGVMRVWTKPYGTTGTARLVATAAGSGIAAWTGPIGGLAGDVPGELDVTVTLPDDYVPPFHTSRDGRVLALAALPHPSYRIAYSGTGPHLTLLDPGAIGGTTLLQFLGTASSGAQSLGTVNQHLAKLSLDPAVYRGRNRLLAHVIGDYPGFALRALDAGGAPLGGTGIASQWYGAGLVDLGTFNVPDNDASSFVVAIDGGRLAATGYWAPPSPSGYQRRLQVKAFHVMPEEAMCLVIDARVRGLALDSIDPAASGALANAAPEQFGNSWATSPMATAGGLWLFPASLGFAGNYHPSLTGMQTLGNQLTLPAPERDMRIEVPVHFTSASGAHLDVMKVAATDSYVRAGLRHAGSAAASGQYLDLEVVANGTQVAYASSGDLDPDFRIDHWVLRLHTQGPVISAAAIRDGNVHEISASAAQAEMPGQPVVRTTATVNASLPAVRVHGMRVTAAASIPMQAGQRYRFDGVNGRVSRLTPSGAWQEDVSTRQRGNIPRAGAPTCAGIALLAVEVDGDPTFNPTVEVRVRERFTFIR